MVVPLRNFFASPGDKEPVPFLVSQLDFVALTGCPHAFRIGCTDHRLDVGGVPQDPGDQDGFPGHTFFTRHFGYLFDCLNERIR